MTFISNVEKPVDVILLNPKTLILKDARANLEFMRRSRNDYNVIITGHSTSTIEVKPGIYSIYLFKSRQRAENDPITTVTTTAIPSNPPAGKYIET